MKNVFSPFGIVAFLVAMLGLVISKPLIAVLGLVAWLACAAYLSIKSSGSQRHESAVSNEGRTLLRPLKALRNDINKIVDSFGDRPDIKVIGNEALLEADALIEHTARLVEIHDDVVKTLKGRSEAEHEIKQTEAKITSEENGPIKDAMIAGVAARKSELQRYEELEKTKENIVAKLKQAETALFEIKAKLSASAVGAQTDDLEQDELTGMVNNLKSLSASFDEAEELVRDRIT